MRRTDVTAAERLCRRLFPEVTQRLSFLSECASRKKGDTGSLAFVALAGQRLAGIVCCQVLDKDVLPTGADPIAQVDLIGVDARFRRRGIATTLWKRMEARLRALGIRSAWTRSRVLGWGLDLVQHPEAVVFFLKAGFEKRQDVYDMTADLRGLDLDTCRAEAKLRLGGIDLKRIEPSEREALSALLSSVFPHWLDTVKRVPERGPQRLHIASAQDSVIGFAVSDGEWFGPIGVDPAYRGKGIGRTLLLRCLRDVRERGHERALIGWANFPFYARTISAPITRILWQMEKRIGPAKCRATVSRSSPEGPGT